MIERREHRFQLNANDGGKVRGYANMLLQRGQETRQRYAHGVQTRSELFAAEDALCVGQEIERRGTQNFRNQLYRRA